MALLKKDKPVENDFGSPAENQLKEAYDSVDTSGD